MSILIESSFGHPAYEEWRHQLLTKLSCVVCNIPVRTHTSSQSLGRLFGKT